jgi:HNH endonuclease
MTIEHVIPESLGGKLTCHFLCKTCNSRFGHHHEGKAKTDPALRLLAATLRSSSPALASRLEEGQAYLAVGNGPARRGHVRRGEFKTRAQRLPDGSLLQATPDAQTSIAKMLRKEGLAESDVDAALSLLNSSPEDARVSLSPGIEVVKWSVDRLEPDLNGPLLNPIVPVKCAYEFLALHVGAAVYQTTPPLLAIRGSLQSGVIDPKHIEVERLFAAEAKPFHGLLFEGNTPHAKVMVRLFVRLAFRIHFKRLSVSGARRMYTHDLSTDRESVRQLAAVAA